MPALPDLSRHLDDCQCADRADLQRKLRQISERLTKNQPADRLIADFQHQAEKSLAKSAARRTALPCPSYDENLPVCQKRDELKAAIEAHQVVIVCGETGSGKTTQLPKICLELGRGVHGLIGHTQPRRLAARSVASRIAPRRGPRTHR